MSQSITTIFDLFEGAAIFTQTTEHTMSEKMVSNIAAWAVVPKGETVIAVTTTDMMQSGRKGMAIGATGVYWKNGVTKPEMTLTWEQLAQTTDSLIARPGTNVLEFVGGKGYDAASSLVTNTALKDLVTRLAQYWEQSPEQFEQEAAEYGRSVDKCLLATAPKPFKEELRLAKEKRQKKLDAVAERSAAGSPSSDSKADDVGLLQRNISPKHIALGLVMLCALVVILLYVNVASDNHPSSSKASTNDQTFRTNSLTHRVSRDQFDDGWPYTVPELTLRCTSSTDGKRIYVTGAYDGVVYGINGKASRSKDYRSHDEIWRADPNSPGSRVPHNSLIIEYGLALCHKQNHLDWVASGKEWYTYKGTLHTKHIDSWEGGTPEDQLVTAGDHFTGFAKSYKPGLLDVGDFDEQMEFYAEDMRDCIDGKIRRTFDDTTVDKVAHACFFQLYVR